MHYYTQDKLGDVVYAELPEKGLELEIEGLLIITMVTMIYGRVWVVTIWSPAYHEHYMLHMIYRIF